MQDKTQLGSVELTVNEGVGTITFFHPSHNSLPGNLLAKLTQTINEAGTNEAIKVIVLKSAGERTFCAGASFDELASIEDFPTGKQFFLGFANVINACRKCPKLIIGRVQGKAVGGGVGLAAACDYVLVTENASIKLTELTIGIGPFVIEPAVKRKIGVAGITELTLDATNWKNAYWAKEKGLYAKVFENIKELNTEVANFSEKLASYNLEALAEMKKVLWKGTENWNELLAERAAISGELVLSDFTKKALEKFKK